MRKYVHITLIVRISRNVRRGEFSTAGQHFPSSAVPNKSTCECDAVNGPAWRRLGKLHGFVVFAPASRGRSCILAQIECMESDSELKEKMDSSMVIDSQS